MKYNLNIPGWMSEADLTVLAYLASHVPESGHILEIGTFLGRSTSALLLNKHESVSLDIVDTWSTDDSAYSPTNDYLNIRGNIEWFNELKLLASDTKSWLDPLKLTLGEDFKRLTAHKMNSKDFVISKDYNLVFIDGGHSFEDVKSDIDKFDGENTLIVGDDFLSTFPGVPRAITAKRRETGFCKTLVAPQRTKLWIMLPMNASNPWKDIVLRSGLL
jgi:hypothetical protein